MLHVWYIYLQNWVIYGVNVGKYSIHGAYRYGKMMNFDGWWLASNFSWTNIKTVSSGELMN